MKHTAIIVRIMERAIELDYLVLDVLIAGTTTTPPQFITAPFGVTHNLL